MRTFGIATLLTSFIATAAVQADAQLLTENFPYNTGELTSLNGGANVSDSTWIGFSGTGHPLLVVDGNLSFNNYPESGVGRELQLVATSSSAEDAYSSFPKQPAGTTVYASFLVSVADSSGLTPNTNATGDYFVALLPSTSASTFVARVSVHRGSASNSFQLGLRASSGNAEAEWIPANLAYASTHLVVIRYRMVDGAQNDTASLWIDPAFNGPEPDADVTQVTASSSDVADVGRIAIRQGSGTPNVEIDGIVVSNFWGPNPPLPLELVSFTGFLREDNEVELHWQTLSEVGNYGFLVQKALSQDDPFQTVSDIVPGHGTTSVPQSYSFVDSTSPAGQYYRLEQIDLDQEVHFSEPIGISGISSVVAPQVRELSVPKNFPNPFNPSTVIRYRLAEAAMTRLEVFDVLGRKVETLVEESQGPGEYSVNWDAAGLAGGVYLYRFISGRKSYCGKMLLLR